MRTPLNIDDVLLDKASKLTVLKEKTSVVREPINPNKN